MLCCWCNGTRILSFVCYSRLLQLCGTLFFIDSPKIPLNSRGDNHVLCTSWYFFPLLHSYCFAHFCLMAQLSLPMKFWVDGVSSMVWDDILCGRWFCIDSLTRWGLPRCLSGEESTWHCRRRKRVRFDPWVGKMPWSRKWQPHPSILAWREKLYFILLRGYSHQGRKSFSSTLCIPSLRWCRIH